MGPERLIRYILRMDITHGQSSKSNQKPAVLPSARGISLTPADERAKGGAAIGGKPRPSLSETVDFVELSASASRAGSLTSARVNVPVSFDHEPPRVGESAAARVAGSALPMYPNPTVKNAVETELAVGRKLDVQA